ncbi:DUF1080 domain-containing protein [Bacteroidota bacterium]
MIPIFRRVLIPSVLTILLSCSSSDQGPWKPLFNGTDLTEFEQLGGVARYRVEDGVIIGTTVANTENSFMATKQIYDDFILEFKVLVDSSLNSGVQIRSNTYLNGRVHGYQVEIDPTPRGYSGGIYDEARLAWLNDLSENETGRLAFKNHEWNQYRVEAIGNSIKTWINGVMCANLVDEFDEKGYIAFQVHNVDVVKKPWTEGVEVKWKDIRIMTEELDTYRFKGEDPLPVKVSSLTNRLTDNEIEAGWELLFDGVSTDKWRSVNKETFPDFGWIVENGTLHLVAQGNEESQGAGDIMTKEVYSNFEFSVDFMLSEGASSGIKYFVSENEKTSGNGIGLEYQLLDDAHYENDTKGFKESWTLGSLYDLIPAKKKWWRDVEQWNMARIVSDGDRVFHLLNGDTVVRHIREAEAGHILLQEDGTEVAFKNIKIRKLNP